MATLGPIPMLHQSGEGSLYEITHDEHAAEPEKTGRDAASWRLAMEWPD